MFMRAYQDMVFSTAARLTGNDAQAEDIAQEVFLRAYQHFAELKSSLTAGGWLKTVTVNLALNFLTRHAKRFRSFADLGGDADEEVDLPIDGPISDTLFANLDAEERRARVDVALGRLPENQRLALVLYHFEELSYQQIAETLHRSLSMVKTDIHRARAALLAYFLRTGEAS
jgi:RNA polymerase sigma-70 factor (ECF subfamily)